MNPKRFIAVALLIFLGIPAWTLFCWEWWLMCHEWLAGHGVSEILAGTVTIVAGIGSWFIAMFALAWHLESKWQP